MPRRKRCRWVTADPAANFFKPRGIPMAGLERVVLGLDEVEAMRLADLEGRYQEEAAAAMGVSRPTFGRIVEAARRKVADALLNGKALAIEPGAAATLPCRPVAGNPSKKSERKTGMKLAVTADAEGLEARIDGRFGRCPAFVIIDPETMEHRTVKNTAAGADSGAGIDAAQAVVNLGVTAVVTGHCGPKAYSVLSRAGIVVYTGASGTVRDAVEAFKAGRLQLASRPDAAGHSGMRS
ncbi:MAG: NifB/NifX family molybdenum-iron cluster-binding protein [candidate division WOR-3 bacterium]